MTSLLLSLTLLAGDPTSLTGAQVQTQTDRSMIFEFKLGPYMPLVDRDFTGTGPYASTFGGSGKHLWMLLGELEFERQFFQKFGTLAAGVSGGYAEKYAHTLNSDGTQSSDVTSLKVVPLKLLAVYRWDWLVQTYGIPLVPYLKAGLVLMPWWISKGSGVEVADGLPGQGVNYGFTGTAGLSLQLDFLDPRLARDFDTGMGVNHTYLFAEYTVQEVNNFESKSALDLSSRHWMFGVCLEF